MPRNTMPDKTLEAFTTQAFASTFTPDISNAATVKVTLTGLMSQVNAPTGRSFGIYTLCFVQNGTGGNFVGWNTTDYPDFAVGDWVPNLQANSVSSISFYYDSDSGKWRPFSAFNGDMWAFRSSGTANSNNRIRVGNQSIGADSSGVTVSGLTASGLISAATTIQAGTLRGGTASGGNLQLSSTSNATKGKITFGTSAYDEVNNRLGIGNTTPGQALDVTGQGVFSSTVTHAEPTASTHSATKNYVDSKNLASMATSTTAIGTTITAVTGLSIASVPAGTWSIYAYVPIVTVGSPTAFTVTVSPSSAPTTSTLRLMATTRRNGTADGVGESATFSNAMALGVQSAVPTILEVYGGMVSSTTGTISISATRTGGTSMTVQAGAYLRLERLA